MAELGKLDLDLLVVALSDQSSYGDLQYSLDPVTGDIVPWAPDGENRVDLKDIGWLLDQSLIGQDEADRSLAERRDPGLV